MSYIDDLVAIGQELLVKDSVTFDLGFGIIAESTSPILNSTSTSTANNNEGISPKLSQSEPAGTNIYDFASDQTPAELPPQTLPSTESQLQQQQQQQATSEPNKTNETTIIVRISRDEYDLISNTTKTDKTSSSSTSSIPQSQSTKSVVKSSNTASNNAKKGEFACTQCGKIFSYAKNLKVHLKWHADPASHQCSVCHQFIKTKRNLTIHMMIHTGEKPHECPLCGSRYNRASSLKDHLRRHDKSSFNYICEKCGKGFFTQNDIKKHARFHNPDRRTLQCPQCNDRFSTNAHLKTHMIVHTGERRFGCQICGLHFTHLKTYHKHRRAKKCHHIILDPSTFSQFNEIIIPEIPNDTVLITA